MKMTHIIHTCKVQEIVIMIMIIMIIDGKNLYCCGQIEAHGKYNDIVINFECSR